MMSTAIVLTVADAAKDHMRHSGVEEAEGRDLNERRFGLWRWKGLGQRRWRKGAGSPMQNG
jgi:hypothetical protein